MPEPTLRVRRSARRLPVNTLRETMWRYSSFLRNASSNSFERSAARAAPCVVACLRPRRPLPCAGMPVSEPAVIRDRETSGTSGDLARALQDLRDDRVGLDAL